MERLNHTDATATLSSGRLNRPLWYACDRVVTVESDDASGTARAAPAQDADRALRHRGPAGRLAGAVASFRPRPLRRHRAQRDGRSRGDGLHRESPHLGRPGAHRQGLPLLRRQPDGDEAARAAGDPSPRGPAVGRSTAAARQRRRGDALPAHPVRGRGDDAQAPRRDVPPPRVPAPGGAARAADPGHGRGRRAEPHPAHRPLLLPCAARRGGQLLQPALRRPGVHDDPPAHRRRAERAARGHRRAS